MRKIVTVILLLLCMQWFTTALAEASGEVPSSNEPENITLTFEKEVQISPDGYYLTGGFCRINHVPQTDLFALTFGAVIGDTQTTTGMEGGTNYFYKEYTLDLEYNGNTGYIHHGGGDSASIMVDDYYYFLTGGPNGWVLKKINPVTWDEDDTKEVKITIPLDSAGQGKYGLGDQMLAYANGNLDASALHVQEAEPTDGSHHHLYTLDLEFVDAFLLHDTSHIDGASMIFANGAYQFVTADEFFGQLIVMQYDSSWYYLGYKPLITNGLWSQGLLWDEELQKYFVAYVFRQSGGWNNIHLAIFDKDWNLVDDMAVTDYPQGSGMSGGRPWVIRHQDKFYVSYDVDTTDPITKESNHDWTGYVNVYGLSYSTGCSTWSDVISKYNKYVASQATWTDVITCYTSYTSH